MSAIALAILAISSGCETTKPKHKDKKKKTPMWMRDDGAPKVGQLAPEFKLKTLDGTAEIELASFRGKSPVVLLFGSYT
jgi:hypothetical protein